MKKVLFVCLVLFACSKPKSLAKYSVTIYRYRISKFVLFKSPGSLEKDTLRYVIKEKDDTTAFIKGFKIWYEDFREQLTKSMKDSSTMRSRVVIKDPFGSDLEKKIPRKIIDSIERSYLKSFFKNQN